MSALLSISLVTHNLSIGLKEVSLAHLLGVSHHLSVSGVILVEVGSNEIFALCKLLYWAKADQFVGKKVELAVFLVLGLSGKHRSSDLRV